MFSVAFPFSEDSQNRAVTLEDTADHSVFPQIKLVFFFILVHLVLRCMKTKTNRLHARPQSRAALVAVTKITAKVTAWHQKSGSRFVLQFIVHTIEGDVAQHSDLSGLLVLVLDYTLFHMPTRW